jgi:hypothetical protein
LTPEHTNARPFSTTLDPDSGEYLGCAGAVITVTVLDDGFSFRDHAARRQYILQAERRKEKNL